MTYDEDNLSFYISCVTERHKIWQRRQNNEPGPWTTNPVMANRKFTNMFRVLDPGSQFVFELDTEDPMDVITRLVFYRLTNRPETWDALRERWDRYPLAADFSDDSDALLKDLMAYRDAGNQVFSGAYIIIPEPGTTNDKVEGAVSVTRRFVLEKAEEFLKAQTEDERFAVLRSTPGLGPFLSMQILADWGYLQAEEPDLSFVVAGPGARRGAKALNPDMSAEDVIYDAATAWMVSDEPLLEGRPLTPMDVQNTFCEFGKYLKEMEDLKKTTPYKPAHPGAQPKPVLPQWW